MSEPPQKPSVLAPDPAGESDVASSASDREPRPGSLRQPTSPSASGPTPPILRLLDPDALDVRKGPRAKVSIVVPQNWLRQGARLELDLPGRLRCDICDGGGCDPCARSGAYVRPEGSSDKIAITLPKVIDDAIAVRVTNPFGDQQPTMLVVRVAAADLVSPTVRWVGPNHDQPLVVGGVAVPGTAKLPAIPIWVRQVSAAVLVIGVAAAMHWCR